ncbi:hypothetical protein [Reyranella sp. CPCC 100927]|uniref:hypothetical protein n=1 Tax=Reyranella sp. CPCC 100927 TaxID=2599616 RepID=UPI0011B4FD29|nr:hypothetical protein [Reyranella sp. CPCC 100927]TWT01991.1 hypothetical protein FQU96_30905 [Reyranella sp. CPCC 100927]
MILIAGGTVLSSCAWVGGCGFDDNTYAQLRRGMTNDEVAQLTGCRGMTTSPPDGKPKDSRYRAWSGPRGPVAVEFVNDRVESWRVTGARI